MSHEHHDSHSHRHHHHEEDDGEEISQVRSIIRQINEETPVKEKSREVVVRPDGSKVVRVTKKRKVMVTLAEKRRRIRRAVMMGIFTLLLLLGCFAAFFFYRMWTVSSESYLAEREQDLCRLWGASSVRCVGASISGVKFHVDSVVAEFPDESMLERVELRDVEAELDTGTFFNGVFTGKEVNVARADIRLRSTARVLHMPQQKGKSIWRFDRVICPDFNVSLGDSASAPWSISKASAYMYHPSIAGMTVVTFDGGVMRIKGWKDIHISSGKATISALAIDNFDISGSVDGQRTPESMQTSLAMSGSLLDDRPLEGPYYFVAENMNFSDFTEGRFVQFFAATTVMPSRLSETPSTHILLPLDSDRPSFSGTFHLRNVSVSNFPALQLMLEHFETARRKRYLPPTITLGTVDLSHEGETIVLSFNEEDMTERDVISLRGTFRVDDANILSGTLDYGVPATLTHTEYKDGMPDPIFQENGHLAWLCTTLSGMANRPDDNSRETDARVQAERDKRERSPLEDIDLDRLSEQYNINTSSSSTDSTNQQQSEQGDRTDSRLLPQ